MTPRAADEREPGGKIRHRRGHDRPATRGEVKDPVCGMYMDPRLAIRHSGKEGDVFFCSDECRQRYLNR